MTDLIPNTAIAGIEAAAEAAEAALVVWQSADPFRPDSMDAANDALEGLPAAIRALADRIAPAQAIEAGWKCAACRAVGMWHCSDPINCGHMMPEMDTWLSWIDDLPLPPEFREGQDNLQEFICALADRIAPPPDVAGLVERLRERDKSRHGFYGYVPFNRDGDRAADALTAMSGQVAALTEDIARHVATASAEADRAEKAKVDAERLGRELNMARYGQPDFAWSIHKQAMAEMTARAEAAEARVAALTAELDAALAQVAGAVQIKPLVWAEVEGQPCTRFSAAALGGEMNIVELDPGLFSANFDIGGLAFRFVLAQHDDGYGGTYSAPAQWLTVEAAKAAAQADYEARIRSALIPATPAPDVAQAARDGWADLLAAAIVEAEKAMRKFPQPNYVISKVAEEAGEVVKAAIHCAENRETVENVRGEVKQLIAMLYRLWVEGDGVHGLRAIGEANHG